MRFPRGGRKHFLTRSIYYYYKILFILLWAAAARAYHRKRRGGVCLCAGKVQGELESRDGVVHYIIIIIYILISL